MQKWLKCRLSLRLRGPELQICWAERAELPAQLRLSSGFSKGLSAQLSSAQVFKNRLSSAERAERAGWADLKKVARFWIEPISPREVTQNLFENARRALIGQFNPTTSHHTKIPDSSIFVNFTCTRQYLCSDWPGISDKQFFDFDRPRAF